MHEPSPRPNLWCRFRNQALRKQIVAWVGADQRLTKKEDRVWD